MENSPTESKSPSISLPKGGGAIQGIGETFSPNMFSGTGNFTVPIYTSPGREGFGPELSLNYSTGSGNGIFGMGWSLSIPRITRKTEKGLPRYNQDDNDPDNIDAFVLSGAEDLLPVLRTNNPDTIWKDLVTDPSGNTSDAYTVTRYLPRTEGLFARIESWIKYDTTNPNKILEHFWRVTTKDNVTSIYGRNHQSQIRQTSTSPNIDDKIYEWLLEETFDSKGNHIYYQYMEDKDQKNSSKIYEENRNYYNRYPRRILYGNLPNQLSDYSNQPFTAGIEAIATSHLNPFETLSRQYAYELLFDYADLTTQAGSTLPFTYPPQKTNQKQLATEKSVRPDPFSSFRPGFELRTLRRCSRVLMLHHFKELGATQTTQTTQAMPILIKSTNFEYQESSKAQLSLLKTTTITGYKKQSDGSYNSTSMPPLTFQYSDFRPQEQSYQSIDADQFKVPSVSLADSNTSLVDLFGNGLQDFVQTNDGGMQYWRNLGGGLFDQPHRLHNSPAGLKLADRGVYFADTGGDGLTDLVVQNENVSGFFELEAEKVVNERLKGGWSNESFKRVTKPSIDPASPNVKTLDLTGDGLTDILLTTDTEFIWWQGKGEEGFSEQKHIIKSNGLENIFFDDPSGRVRLADMSGDGLSDIVLLHNGRIDYWPNLGYGHFGKRITMSSKAFKLPLEFNPKRLFLVDIDGSGLSDIVYVDFNETHFWFNLSGNSLSEKQTISGTPITVDNTAISFVDFYGTGTACLVWSYDFGTFKDSNYKVLDFCDHQKPYLMTSMDNNLGAITKVQYASSTKFYLQDVADKNFWATPLPFPVQVVEKTESIDAVSNSKLVSSYKYHHGFYDGKEREFRGFGRVDQIDTESFNDFAKNIQTGKPAVNADKVHYSPPVETRSWFHTGAYYESKDILERYKKEYFAGLDKLELTDRPKDPAAFDLGKNEIIDNDPATIQEAHRVLRGSVLRTEVYAHDTTAQKNFPYLVTEGTYQVKKIQSKSSTLPSNNHAVFINTAKDQVSYHYERIHSGKNLVDPRVQQTSTLEIDDYGNPLSSTSIAYKRRQSSYLEQSKDLISISNASYCDPIDDLINYRHSVGHASQGHELTGMTRSLNTPFTTATLNTAINNASNIRYEQQPTNGQLEKRLLSSANTLFWKDDLSGSETLGKSGVRALAYEAYTLALTPTLRTSLFGSGKISLAMGAEGGYRSKTANQWVAPNSGNWWIPSGKQEFSPQHFYQAVKAIDPFDAEVQIKYDPYFFFPVRITDPLNNIQEGQIDYRTLQPFLTRDLNGNHSEAAFDILGMLVGSAIMGKAGRAPSASILGIDQASIDQMRTSTEADSLKGFVSDISETAQKNLFDKPDGLSNTSAPYSATLARNALKQATSRVVYDLFAFQNRGEAARTCSIVREQHHKDNASSPLQISYTFSDGFGRSIQEKAQAEPLKSGSNKDKRRWVVSGWSVFNNKGNVVKQFEPSFSFLTSYEPDVETGVSTVSFYDPMQRVIGILNPDHSYEKVIFTPWQQASWDGNDTVSLDPTNDVDVKDYMKSYIDTLSSFKTWHEQRDAASPSPGITAADQQASIKTIKHAKTPTISHTDSFGTTFLTQANNKPEIFETKLGVDIQGNDLSITDPRGITLFEHSFDMTGRKLFIDSKDAGEKRLFPAIDENPLLSWDANNNHIFTSYDQLRRPTEIELKKPSQPAILVDKFIYGESRSLPETVNARGQLWKHYDSAGLATVDSQDFKGNVLSISRKLLVDTRESETAWPKDSNDKFDESAATALLESTTRLNTASYSVSTSFDALNRLKENTLPNGAIQTPIYNQASLLEGVSMQQAGQANEVYVQNIDYNAKGQREQIRYGNGVLTEYDYQPETFRLKSILSRRAVSPKTLQKLSYTYDPVGNITSIRDDAHKITFNQNQTIEPESTYSYDALYRLTKATGREHESMTACHYQTNGKKHTEFLPLPQSTANAQALINYIESYQYDKSGNITRTEHNSLLSTGARTRIRNQTYTAQNNRIIKSNAGCANENQILVHDTNGNMTKLAHLPEMKWDYKNQLVEVQLNTGSNPNRAFYQYDGNGQRIRKTVVRNSGADISERIYLGDYEIYTETIAGTTNNQRETIHISHDQVRIALIEIETSLQNTANPPTTLKRFQLLNHLGSATQELDETGQHISYEEYYPYGGTAYTAGRNQTEVSLKRYRYSGKERDDETGLYYYGARYYASWLHRWINPDPIGPKDDVNLFQFVKQNPVKLIDLFGLNTEKALNNLNSLKAQQNVLSEQHLQQQKTIIKTYQNIAELAELVNKPDSPYSEYFKETHDHIKSLNEKAKNLTTEAAMTHEEIIKFEFKIEEARQNYSEKLMRTNFEIGENWHKFEIVKNKINKTTMKLQFKQLQSKVSLAKARANVALANAFKKGGGGTARGVRIGGTMFLAYGLYQTGKSVKGGIEADIAIDESYGQHTMQTVATQASGWTGAMVAAGPGAEVGATAGAAIGVWIGGAGAVPGALIGGFFGGLIAGGTGFFVGSTLAEKTIGFGVEKTGAQNFLPPDQRPDRTQGQ